MVMVVAGNSKLVVGVSMLKIDAPDNTSRREGFKGPVQRHHIRIIMLPNVFQLIGAERLFGFRKQGQEVYATRCRLKTVFTEQCGIFF